MHFSQRILSGFLTSVEILTQIDVLVAPCLRVVGIMAPNISRTEIPRHLTRRFLARDATEVMPREK